MHFLCSKFHLHILRTYKVTDLQSSCNRKIDLYSKYRKNKLQVLIKTDVTYEWSAVHTRNLHHSVCHKLRNGLLSKSFLFLSWVSLNKVEINEETPITSNHFDVTWTNNHNLQILQSNKEFWSPLAWVKKFQFKPLATFFTKNEACKEVTDFFS